MTQFWITASMSILLVVLYAKLRERQNRKDRETLNAFYRQYVPEDEWPEYLRDEGEQ